MNWVGASTAWTLVQILVSRKRNCSGVYRSVMRVLNGLDGNVYTYDYNRHGFLIKYAIGIQNLYLCGNTMIFWGVGVDKKQTPQPTAIAVRWG